MNTMNRKQKRKGWDAVDSTLLAIDNTMPQHSRSKAWRDVQEHLQRLPHEIEKMRCDHLGEKPPPQYQEIDR